jgi:hypothetical protein
MSVAVHETGYENAATRVVRDVDFEIRRSNELAINDDCFWLTDLVAIENTDIGNCCLGVIARYKDIALAVLPWLACVIAIACLSDLRKRINKQCEATKLWLKHDYVVW